MMIDWSRTRTLRAEIGAEDFDDVVAMFLDEVEEALDDLCRRTAGDEVAAGLHFLKGGALNLGFSALAETCHAGETALHAGEVDAVDTAAIAAVYAASREAFLDGLSALDDDAATTAA